MRSNARRPARYEVVELHPSTWVWQLVAEDGELVARAYGTYATRDQALDGLAKAQLAHNLASDLASEMQRSARSSGGNGNGDEPEAAAA